MSPTLSPQSQYRILVEIVNENDNRPNFLEETIQPFTVSEVKHAALTLISQPTHRSEQVCLWAGESGFPLKHRPENRSSGAVLILFYRTVVMKKELSQKAKLSLSTCQFLFLPPPVVMKARL